MAKTDHRLPTRAGGASLTRPSATQPLLSAAPSDAITSWLSAVAIRTGGGEFIEPTGLRITINGVTVAEFRGDRICSFRQYWDEFAVLEQFGVLSDREQ